MPCTFWLIEGQSRLSGEKKRLLRHLRPGHGLRQPPMCWMIDVSEDIRIVSSDP
ncbi:MAG: hypothetical protein ABF576_12940 [Gluconobacter japonicus]